MEKKSHLRIYLEKRSKKDENGKSIRIQCDKCSMEFGIELEPRRSYAEIHEYWDNELILFNKAIEENYIKCPICGENVTDIIET